MAVDAKDAFERGLKGKDLTSLGDVINPFFSGHTKDEESAHQRGLEAKSAMDEAERRMEARREPEPTYDYSSSDSSPSYDSYDSPAYAPPQPVVAPGVTMTGLMPYERAPEEVRLAEVWTVAQFVRAWNAFCPKFPLSNTKLLHESASYVLRKKHEEGKPYMLTLEDFTEDVLLHYFSFSKNKEQRMADNETSFMFWDGHFEKRRALTTEFIRVGAVKP